MRSTILTLLSVLMLTGCGLFGGGYGDVSIDSVRKGIVVANAEVRAVNMLLQELIRTDSISSDDAQDVLNHLRTVNNALRDANRAVDETGDPLAAENAVARAQSGLNLAWTVLSPLLSYYHEAVPEVMLVSTSINDFKEAA